MKIQLISDLKDRLVAIQLPIEEYLRLKRATGERVEDSEYGRLAHPSHSEKTVSKPQPEPPTDLPTPKPTTRPSASISDILGRDSSEEYKHYTIQLEGTWLGPPKKGQKEAAGNYYEESDQSAFRDSTSSGYRNDFHSEKKARKNKKRKAKRNRRGR